MVGAQVFELKGINCSVKKLEIDDADILQQLYEKCADYNYLMEGQPPSPTAALDEFTAIPAGRSLNDKYMLGIFNPQDELIGLIEGMRHYPEENSWWIGLIMLAPAHRCQGILSALIEEFERWIATQRMDCIMGSVSKANEKVLRLWKQIGFKVVRNVEREDSNSSSSFSIIKRKVGYPS